MRFPFSPRDTPPETTRGTAAGAEDEALRPVAVPLPPPGAETVVPADAPRACAFCGADAVALCPRCGTPYCRVHGGGACDTCSQPLSGLPGATVLRASVGVFIAGIVIGLILLVRPPRLPGERPPAVAATPALPSPTVVRTATPAGIAPATATPTPRTYRVRPGDTLGRIAVEFGTTIEAIQAANPGINPNALTIDQEIIIPGGR